MDKNVEISCLLDFYSEFLTQRQQMFMDLHFNQDLSLSEIAEQEGISRQGVHDALKRGESSLYEMESRLGLMKRYNEVAAKLARLRDRISVLPVVSEGKEKLDSVLSELNGIIGTWEDGHGI